MRQVKHVIFMNGKGEKTINALREAGVVSYFEKDGHVIVARHVVNKKTLAKLLKARRNEESEM